MLWSVVWHTLEIKDIKGLNMDLRKELYYYRENKRKITELEEKIIYLRAKAEKITPTFSDDGPSRAMGNDSKVERNMIKILEIETQLAAIREKVLSVDDYLKGLKPYQRYIITMCIVNHIPYNVLAKREKTTVKNIDRIIEKALKNP